MKETYSFVNINSYLNNKGITDEDQIKLGDLSIGKSSIPLKLIEKNNPFTVGNIPFSINTKEKFDNICAENQRIEINTNLKNIYILGVSCQGDYFEEMKIIKDENVIEKFNIGFTDFLSSKPYFNDVLAFRSEYSHTQTGIAKDLKISIWLNSISLDRETFVKNLILPDNIFLHIFGITIS